MHAWARPAAEMAACAYAQGSEVFWNVPDFLFMHQADLTLNNLNEKLIEMLRERTDVSVRQY